MNHLGKLMKLLAMDRSRPGSGREILVVEVPWKESCQEGEDLIVHSQRVTFVERRLYSALGSATGHWLELAHEHVLAPAHASGQPGIGASAELDAELLVEP